MYPPPFDFLSFLLSFILFNDPPFSFSIFFRVFDRSSFSTF